VRGDASKPCASFQRAYDVSQGGDLVLVAAGTYPNQQIVQNGHSQSGPLTTFRCASARACVINGEIDLGTDNGSSSGVGPSYLTFDGFDFQGFFSSYHCTSPGTVSSCQTAQYLTVENSWVHGWNRGNSGGSDPLVGCCSSHLTVTNNEIGPECCSGDGDETGGGDFFTFTNNYVHDIYDTCRTSGTTRTPTMNRYGSSCQGVGYGDTSAGGCTSNCTSVSGFDHVDGMQLQGGANILIAGNRFSNAGTQAIFMENANNAGYNNVTVENNMVGKVCGGACGNDVSLDSNTSGGIAGTIKFLYNTVQGVTVIGGGSAGQPIASGSTVIVAGNIFGISVGAPSGCGNASGVTYTWSHNLVAPGHPHCGTGTTSGRPTFVDSNPLKPNLELQRGSRGIGTGPTIETRETDIDGHLRPIGRPTDVGASQRETARIVPGRSIGAVSLGEQREAVSAFYGGPGRVSRGAMGLQTARYRVHGGTLDVTYDNSDRIVGVATTALYYRVNNSLGVGSAVSHTQWLQARRIGACSHVLVKHVRGAVVYYKLGLTLPKLTSVRMVKSRYATCTS
jgi:hypothetical protein